MSTEKIYYHPIQENAENIQWVIGSGALALGSLYAWHAGYVIAIKNLSLGQYSFLIFWILLGLGFLWTVWEYISVLKRKKIIKKLPKDATEIVINDKDFSFPLLHKGKCERVCIPYKAVTQLWTKDDEDEGQSQVIYVKKEYISPLGKEWYQRFENFFTSKEWYQMFKKNLEVKCIDITNR